LRRATAPCPVVTAPPPKPLYAKTQLENHMRETALRWLAKYLAAVLVIRSSASIDSASSSFISWSRMSFSGRRDLVAYVLEAPYGAAACARLFGSSPLLIVVAGHYGRAHRMDDSGDAGIAEIARTPLTVGGVG
jgi:hypothetical protein